MSEKILPKTNNMNGLGSGITLQPSVKENFIKKFSFDAYQRTSAASDNNPFANAGSIASQIESTVRQTEKLKEILAVPYGNNLNIMS